MEKDLRRLPIWIVVLCCAFNLSVYALGAYILLGLGVWAPLLYLAYGLWIEFRVLNGSCVNCAYYGRRCGLGRGKLCALLFRKGDPHRFVEQHVTWTDVLPDLLVLVLPVIGGTVSLALGFAWLRLAALVLLLVLYLGGNAVMRGKLACRTCKQREIGCPAERLFGGEEA